jgi:hypothetical protein
MGSISAVYMKKESLETLLKGINAKNLNGIELTISINDESKVFSGAKGDTFQNLSMYVSQSEEDRKAKKDKFYVGNGRVKWTDGKIVVGGDSQSQSAPTQALKVQEVVDDLPF